MMSIQRLLKSGSGARLIPPKSVYEKWGFEPGDEVNIEWDEVFYQAFEHWRNHKELYKNKKVKL